MRITDMIDDCLEKCLEYLSIDELLKVANTNKRLYEVARYVFARLHGRKKLCINLVYVNDAEHNVFNGNSSHIRDLKTALNFFRSFGDLITRVKIYLNEDYTDKVCNSEFVSIFKQGNPAMLDWMMKCFTGSKYEHLIVDYLNEYCCDSLTKIKFYRFSKSRLNQLTKTFRKVEKLVMSSSDATEKGLYEIFPNIRELKLTKCNIHDDFIGNHFPYLEHLEINTNYHIVLSLESIATTLRLNPQLKSLTGYIWWDVIFNTNEFWNTSDNFRNLESLWLDPKHSENTGMKIHFEKLKELVIDCYDLGPDIGTFFTIPFSCNQLESLTMSCKYLDDCVFFNIINNFPSLIKLSLSSDNAINHLKISKVLPLLEEIYFDDYNFFYTFDEIVHFIQELQSLKVFQFHAKLEKLSLKHLREHLSNSFSISTNTNDDVYYSIKLKRKI